jgi:3-methyladenine DNA glycosylase/8-oxoguanine DNA glycosylase
MYNLTNVERPTLTISLDIDVPKLETIKHNMGDVEIFAKKLVEFYDDAIENATDGYLEVAQVKFERTNLRKIIKAVADNRKAMVKAFKEPIQDFEETSKRIEKMLTETDNKLKEIVDNGGNTLADPFEGLSIEPKERVLQFICDDKSFDEIVKYIEKKGGIIVNGK